MSGFWQAGPGLLAVSGLVLLGACQSGVQIVETAAVDVAKGKALYEENCAACHGSDARGGGPASLGLGIVPPDLTRLKKDNKGVFPANETMSAIDGYYRREHFNNPMPIFGDEDLGPLIEVETNGLSTPIPANLLALSNYLEKIQD